MAKITFKNVTKKYGNKLVLDNLTINFPEKGFVSIVGPSGAGKTTILNLLLKLTAPDSGVLSVSDKCSVVFQEDRLLPWENVLNNVLLPCSDPSDKVTYNKALLILSELGLGAETENIPAGLSGGMARRAAIARALAVDADIYIMDEPTRGLDDETRRSVLEIIHKYTDRALDQNGNSLNKLLIMITHNPDETDDSVMISI